MSSSSNHTITTRHGQGMTHFHVMVHKGKRKQRYVNVYMQTRTDATHGASLSMKMTVRQAQKMMNRLQYLLSVSE